LIFAAVIVIRLVEAFSDFDVARREASGEEGVAQSKRVRSTGRSGRARASSPAE
jgi:hypothetical protein